MTFDYIFGDGAEAEGAPSDPSAPAAEHTEGETDRTCLTVAVFDARLKRVAAKVESILQTVDGIADRLEDTL